MTPSSLLTVREMKVVTLIASGLSPKAAAWKMGIDPASTAHHHQSAMKKLRVTDTIGLKRAAIRMGLIEPERSPRVASKVRNHVANEAWGICGDLSLRRLLG